MTRRRILCRTFMLVLIAAVCGMGAGVRRRRGGCVGLHISGAGEMVEISELVPVMAGGVDSRRGGGWI